MTLVLFGRLANSTSSSHLGRTAFVPSLVVESEMRGMGGGWRTFEETHGLSDTLGVERYSGPLG